MFRVAKQMTKRNVEVVGEGCVKDSKGKIIVDDSKVMERWREYYQKLLNEESEWDGCDIALRRMVMGQQCHLQSQRLERL